MALRHDGGWQPIGQRDLGHRRERVRWRRRLQQLYNELVNRLERLPPVARLLASVLGVVVLVALLGLLSSEASAGRKLASDASTAIWDAWPLHNPLLAPSTWHTSSASSSNSSSSQASPRVPDILHGLSSNSHRSHSKQPYVQQQHQQLQQQSRRILLISYDISGPNLNGGIGTANTNMARLLASEHHVTLLHAGGEQVSADSLLSFQGWVSHFQERYGVELVALPLANSYHYASAIYEQVRSYEALLWLINNGHRFDIVHFHDWRGLAYYTLLSAQQGHPALQHLRFVTVCHSSTLWSALGGNTMPASLTPLKIDFMERESIRFSQHIISPSLYFLQWMIQHQYVFPSSSGGGNEVRVMRNPIIVAAAEPDATPWKQSDDQPQQLMVVNEIVFFGRLEYRKGLDIFLDAVDALQARRRLPGPPPVPLPRFTLLGKSSPAASSQLRRRIQLLSSLSHWSVLTNYSAAEATAYLTQPYSGRLAVMPSRTDNSPYTVQEALVHGIPFLAAAVGGVAELIDEQDRAASTFRPTPAALSARMEAVLREGFRPARPSFDVAVDSREWLGWHAALQPPTPRQPLDSPLPSPLVSIVMATFNRTDFILEALRSLRDQTYRNLEVLVVDDGTEHSACVAYLAQVAAFVRSVPSWQMLTVEHGGESVARNRGVAAAKGDFLIFMDDDNIARPEQVATFIRAMHYSKADILTCMADSFREGASSSEESEYRWMPLGPAVGLSVHNNLIGDANFMIRRSVYESLGGFGESVIAEDWELLTRALLAGAAIQLIPHSLLWKRVGAASKQHIVQAVSNPVALTDAYLGPHIPHELGLALLMSRQALAKKAADELRLASSAADFRLKQGYKRWQYHSRLGEHGLLKPMEPQKAAVKGATAEWRLADGDLSTGTRASSASGCIIRSKLQQPCVVDEQPVSVIRTWLVDLDGTVQVSGRILRPQRCPAGGPVAFVQLNQRTVLEEEDDRGHETSEPLEFEVAVELGDSIHFGIRPGEHTVPACREIALEISIALVKH